MHLLNASYNPFFLHLSLTHRYFALAYCMRWLNTERGLLWKIIKDSFMKRWKAIILITLCDFYFIVCCRQICIFKVAQSSYFFKNIPQCDHMWWTQVPCPQGCQTFYLFKIGVTKANSLFLTLLFNFYVSLLSQICISLLTLCHSIRCVLSYIVKFLDVFIILPHLYNVFIL